ncbi:hypothetical protein V865_006036 [Kwoniella europaea PYCC6329]|uniref:Uncharacterized protein n=1 Tax=Kwoniella europaea PYCC6329 TaxID=1423913 RepID=A0AAX4KRH4_9TREE
MAPPPLSHHPSTSSTSSDEPIYISPPASKAGPGPSTHRYIPKRSTAEPKSLVTLDDDAEDEDEPVFVGTKISNLVQKYKLNHDVRVRSSNSSTSRSPSVGPSTVIPQVKSSKKETKVNSSSNTSSGKGKSKGTSKTNQAISILDDDDEEQKNPDRDETQRQPSLPLLPDLALVPLPVPDWLGRTAILLPLDNCVVCKIRFKKTDSGAAKWRHISTCRPPLYRPPNPPPDLKHLINEGLLQGKSKSTEPTSLLDLHVRRSDSLEDVSSTSNKGKKKSTLGLKSFTSVKATHERLEDDWEKQVRSRLKEFIGDSSPPPEHQVELGSKTPSPNTSPSKRKLNATEPGSDTEDEMDLYLPSTQSLGESSLAQIYAKQSPSGSPSGSPSKSPITPVDSPNRQSEDEDADFDIPLPPSSQKRQYSQREGLDFHEDGNDLSCMDENPEEQGEGEGEGEGEGGVRVRTKKPFRGWGDPRVDGDLSYNEIDNNERLFALGWGGGGVPIGRTGGWTGRFV